MVITVDPIGGGLSSRPSDGQRERFPRYTIRDMVTAEGRLVQDVLKLKHLRAVAGASMGSFQALEWAIRYPDSIDRLVLVAPAARSDAHFRSIVTGIEAILTGSDRGWSASGRLRAAAALFMPWLRSDAYLVRRATQPIAPRWILWRKDGHGTGIRWICFTGTGPAPGTTSASRLATTYGRR